MISLLTDPAAMAAFKKFLTDHEHKDLPWEMQEEELKPTFMAGWNAGWNAGATRLHEQQEKQFAPIVVPAPPLVPVPFKEVKASPDAIYAAYPRHVGKEAALRAIEKAAKRVKGWILIDSGPYPQLLRAVEKYADAVTRWPAADKKFIPHPATWFNQGRYDDDPREWQRGAAAVPSQFNKIIRS